MATSGTYSDNEDLDDDIQRLNIVLLADENEEEKESDEELQNLDRIEEEPPSHASHASASYASRPSTTSDVTASSFPTTSMGTEAEDLLLRFDPNMFNAESCLAMNRAYQEVLLDTLRQIDVALNENRARQRELSEDLDEKCNKGGKPSNSNSRPLTDYFTPYFRDKNGGAPPKNDDVHLKAALHEAKQYIRPKRGWTKAERKKLLAAVQLDGLEQQIRPLMNKLEVETNRAFNCKTMEDIEQCKEKIKALKEQITGKQKLSPNELLRLVDTSKIDFMKISAVKLNGKFTAMECESMWKNVLKPGINKEKWSKEEEQRLVEIANKYNMREWQKVAEELGTNRTPFQCLQHFQQNHFVYDTSEWTPEEDALLQEVIDTCQYGVGKIQWHQVAYYMERRSANQCQARYMKISPCLRHGRWTAKEDLLLSTAVKTVGDKDWIRIQEFVPQRSAPQCRERWINCLDPNLNFEPWTYEEDKKLLQLKQKLNRNWTAISSMLPGRTDNRCFCRYRTLMKWKYSMERFNDEPYTVKKNLISSFFNLTPDGEIYPNLQKFESFYKRAEKQRKEKEKKEQATQGDEDSDSDYEPGIKGSQPNDMWEKVAMQGDLQATDYIKQREDKANGDIYVPRPPPLKRYTIKSTAAMWRRRKDMKQLMQKVVDSKTPEEINQPDKAMKSVSNSLDSILKIDSTDPKIEELISKALKGRMPNELSVRELLNLSRVIKEGGSVNNLDDGDDDEDDGDDEEEQEVESEEESEEESSSDDDFDMYQHPAEPAKPKRVFSEAHKTLRLIKFNAHMEVHKKLREVIRRKMDLGPEDEKDTVFQMYPESSSSSSDPKKLANKSLAILMKSFDVDTKAIYENANKRKRQQSAMAFLNIAKMRRSSRQVQKRQKEIEEGKSEENEIIDLVLDLKEELGIESDDDEEEEEEEERMDVDEDDAKEENDDNTVKDAADDDSGKVGHAGVDGKDGELDGSKATGGDLTGQGADQEKSAGMDASKLASDSTISTSNEAQKDSKNKDKDETKKCAGSKDSSASFTDKKAKQVSSEQAGTSSEGQGNNDESDKDSYEKVLPFIPPNLSNLKALKNLLLEHRCMIDTAGRYFDKEELKEHLYALKNSGPNLLLPVFMSVNMFRERMGLAEVTTKPDPPKAPPKKQAIKKIRQTKAYKLLKARFQALFVWPALLSTIERPNKPIMKQIKPSQEAANPSADFAETSEKNQDETVQNQNGISENNVYEISHVEEEVEEEADQADEEAGEDNKVISENVAQAVQEMIDKDEENLTHEQAIEKLVEKILAEYKATRETMKKRPGRRSKKKAEEHFKQMVYRRERVKVLKRLGLWETMEKYRREREDLQALISHQESISVKKEVQRDIDQEEEPSCKIISSEQQGDDHVIEILVEKRQGQAWEQQESKVLKATVTMQNREACISIIEGTPSTHTQDMDKSTGPIQKNGQGQSTGVNKPKKSSGVEIETQTELPSLPEDCPAEMGSPVPELKAEMLPETKAEKQTEEIDVPVKKRRGRPVGSKNFTKFEMENALKSERQKVNPSPLPPINLLGKRPATPQQSPKRTKVKLARLKELIPEKMSTLATQISDLPLIQEAKLEAEKAKLEAEKALEAQKAKEVEKAIEAERAFAIKRTKETEKAEKAEKARRAKIAKEAEKAERTKKVLEAKLTKESARASKGNKILEAKKANEADKAITAEKAFVIDPIDKRKRKRIGFNISKVEHAEQSGKMAKMETADGKAEKLQKSPVKKTTKQKNITASPYTVIKGNTEDAANSSVSKWKTVGVKYSLAQKIKSKDKHAVGVGVGDTSSKPDDTVYPTALFTNNFSPDIEYVAQPLPDTSIARSKHVSLTTNKNVSIATCPSVAMETSNIVSHTRSVLSPEVIRAVSENSSKNSQSTLSNATASVSSASTSESVAMETTKMPHPQVLMALPIKVGDKQQMTYVPIPINLPSQKKTEETSKTDS